MSKRQDDIINKEIFSILESNFLFSQPPHKIRILTVDSSFDHGILAATTLYHLESLLQKRTSDPSASISDFFDLAAGSGSGGLLSSLLFTRGPQGRPLFSAHQALNLLTTHSQNKNSIFNKLFSSSENKLKSIFSDSTLCDTVKPLLISCFDMVTGAPFMFSRSDAVESDAYDFHTRDVCAAATSKHVYETSSIDGRTKIKAVGCGIGNPTAAAITHVLNNKREFPYAEGMEDLFVFSIGGVSSFHRKRAAGDGAAEVVDQSVAMAFGEGLEHNYVRIQGDCSESVMRQRYVKTMMFRGKRLSEETNGEKVDWVAKELVEEGERRKKSGASVVLIKQEVGTPRSSSATTATTVLSSDLTSS